jgi:ADP-ribose pyrophosphatase
MKAWEGERFWVEVDGDDYEIARTPDAVAIVAVDTESRIVLVRQDRPPVGKRLLELPAGLIDDGEEPLESAQRELREETGLHGGDWRQLWSFFSSPGFIDERITVFAAEGLVDGERDLDDGEEVEVVRWSKQELLSNLDQIEDATSLVGLLLYLRDLPG